MARIILCALYSKLASCDYFLPSFSQTCSPSTTVVLSPFSNPPLVLCLPLHLRCFKEDIFVHLQACCCVPACDYPCINWELKSKRQKCLVLCDMGSHWYNAVFWLKFYWFRNYSKANDCLMLLMLLEEAGTGLGYGGEEGRKTALNMRDKVSNQSKQKTTSSRCFSVFFPIWGKMPRVWKEPFERGEKKKKKQMSKQSSRPSLNSYSLIIHILLSTYILFIIYPLPHKHTYTR